METNGAAWLGLGAASGTAEPAKCQDVPSEKPWLKYMILVHHLISHIPIL